MSLEYKYTNYSKGWVVEVYENGSEICDSWILLPAENLWHEGVRATLYIIAMFYIFMGIAIASDAFMCSIEVITSRKRVVVRWDEESQQRVEKEVLIWNETVANLTLMALGSSAPEILLAVIETGTTLGQDTSSDGLGTFTIIGSAAFNLFIISAICVVSVPSPDYKIVKELGVFGLTSAWSIFAYIWMLVVLSWVSPGEIEPWEAWLTFAYFPMLVLTAYATDNGWWLYKCQKNNSTDVDFSQSQTNVRVVSQRRGSTIHGVSKELGALEKERNIKHSRISLRSSIDQEQHITKNNDIIFVNMDTPHETSSERSKDPEGGSMGSQTQLVVSRPGSATTRVTTATRNIARASRFRFRHAAVRSMLGGRRRPISAVINKVQKPKFSEVVDAATKPKPLSEEELQGKLTFASPSYSVLESAGFIEIDLLFHRHPPSHNKTKVANGGNTKHTANGKLTPVENETSFTKSSPVKKSTSPVKDWGEVSVEYETREGSGKIDKDFKFTTGTVVFKETEYKKSITIPIINDNQYEADVDFYVILKNSIGGGGIGDPSVTRVTIIDDDEPGEFQFDEPHYFADHKTSTVTFTVIRQKGCDGTVTIEYSTIDGTAKGGDELGEGVMYKRSDGVLHFKHNETSKTVVIPIAKDIKGSKNFILTLRNPSLGAKIGEHSAALANLTKDDIAERIADVLEDEEEEDVGWAGQFKNAMVLESGKDEDGNDIPFKWYDYLLHFLSFFWKVIFAFIPPTKYLGAYPAFVVSLAAIGICTGLIQPLGELLGCVIGLKTSVTGITIVALGTSLPDTFASRTAALHDSYADAAIGNITGSNSVNVFLGLGLPWVMSTMYHLSKGTKFMVPTDNLVQSVIVFTICGVLCLSTIVIRRKFAGGELGGKKTTKILSGIFFVSLWVIYILFSAINAYYPDAFPW